MKPSKAKGEPDIASLVVHNLKALTSLTDTIEPSYEPTSLADSQLARFKLWSASLGAHRATGNRALEYRLRDASSIRNQVLSLLQDLSTVVDQAHAAAREQPDQLQDDLELNEIDAYFFRDDGPTQTPLDRSLADVGHILDCLLRLCATISNPAPHDQFQSRAGAIVSAFYEPWDVRHVQEKFKDVDSIIAERLGRAITIRRQYFTYRKEHHDKLSDGLGYENDTGGDGTTVASSIPEHLKDTPGITTLLEDLDNKSEFSTTSYAPSSAEPDQLRVPSIPVEHLTGPFLCPFCQMIIELETRRDWKKHVFRDLQPYICIEKSCSTPARQYSRRSEWMNHMGHDHWKTWSCSFGCSEAFTTRDTWHKHIQAAHGQDISSTGLGLLEAGSVNKNLSKAIGNCPLCMTETIKDSRHYRSHIGDHLESLALFSLPKIGGNNDEHEWSDVESDLEPEDQVIHRDDSLGSGGDPTILDETRTLQRFGVLHDSKTDSEEFQEFSSQSLSKSILDGLAELATEASETVLKQAEMTRQEAIEREKKESAAIKLAQQAAQDEEDAETRAQEVQDRSEAEAVARAQQIAHDQIGSEPKVENAEEKGKLELQPPQASG